MIQETGRTKDHTHASLFIPDSSKTSKEPLNINIYQYWLVFLPLVHRGSWQQSPGEGLDYRPDNIPL